MLDDWTDLKHDSYTFRAILIGQKDHVSYTGMMGSDTTCTCSMGPLMQMSKRCCLLHFTQIKWDLPELCGLDRSMRTGMWKYFAYVLAEQLHSTD